MSKNKNTSLRSKLLAVFMIVGLVPVITVAFISYTKADKSLDNANQIAEEALKKQVAAQLEAVREVKGAATERYFQTINDQIITFSQDLMVVNAMRDFRTHFDSYREENEVTPEKLAAMRKSVEHYYTAEFAPEYSNQNSGATVDVSWMYNGLDDDSVALQYAYISDNENPLGSKHLLDAGNDGSTYSRLHNDVHPVIRTYLEKFGYYDIFLADPDTGDIIYSVFKELDYTTSLIDGPYAQTNFGEAFRKANAAGNRDAVFLIDFAQYRPSYDAPASFVASPIFDGDKKVGVALFQMPLDRITEIMSNRSGLGDTGETYMVGGDYLMRSDSYRDQKHRTVIASFKDANNGKVETSSVKEAISGKSGSKVITGYHGSTVLSSYCPVSIIGLRWALLAEINVDEAFSAIKTMETYGDEVKSSLTLTVVGIVAIAGTLIFVIAVVFTKRIISPVIKTMNLLEAVAAGQLTGHLDVTSEDEIGRMGKALNQAVSRLRETIQTIGHNSTTLAGASSELASVSSKMTTDAELTSDKIGIASTSSDQITANAQTVAASTEQLSASINEIAKNTTDAARVANDAVSAAEKTNRTIAKLGESSAEIGKVINVITSIAEQTNLLALNATIEAARAGDAGRGFAVVANEVKELAKETAKATEDIGRRIEAIQGDTQNAVTAIGEISNIINQISDIQNTVASAVEEQTATTSEIGMRISEVAGGSSEITRNMTEVVQVAETTRTGASNAQNSAQDLTRMATELQRLVDQFVC